MVPNIVRFGSELEPSLFVYRERLKKSHVPVRESWLVDEVADELTVESSRGGLRKDRRAIRVCSGEPLPRRAERANDVGVSIDDPILAVNAAAKIRVQSYARVVIGSGYAARQSRLELCDPADLPATERLPSDSRLIPEKRKLVKVIDGYDVPGVELRGSPKHRRI